jgi:hypothetical protein
MFNVQQIALTQTLYPPEGLIKLVQDVRMAPFIRMCPVPIAAGALITMTGLFSHSAGKSRDSTIK